MQLATLPIPSSTPTFTSLALTDATSVNFHETPPSFTVTSATQLIAAVLTETTSGAISVTTPSGSATSSGSFTVTEAVSLPPPTITMTTASYDGELAESVNGALSYLLSDPVLGSASEAVNTCGQMVATQLTPTVRMR